MLFIHLPNILTILLLFASSVSVTHTSLLAWMSHETDRSALRNHPHKTTMPKNKQNGAQARRQSRLQLRYLAIDTKTIDRNISGNLLVFAQCFLYLVGRLLMNSVLFPMANRICVYFAVFFVVVVLLLFPILFFFF